MKVSFFKSVCDLLHIHKARTTPYHPYSNGQVERFNSTLMDAVRCFVREQDEWDLYLPQISSAMRSSINRSRGLTPNRVMLGREVVTPLELVHTRGLPHQEERGVDDYIAGLEQGMRRAQDLARDILKTGQKHMKKSYDLRLYKHQYSEASLVYVLDTAVKEGECAKLVTPWNGPGVVTEVIAPYLYNVRLRDNYTVFNHDRLKPCVLEFSTLPAWIRKHLQRSKSSNWDFFVIVLSLIMGLQWCNVIPAWNGTMWLAWGSSCQQRRDCPFLFVRTVVLEKEKIITDFVFVLHV